MTDQNKKYKCKFCNKEFKSLSSFSKHLNKIENIDVKQYFIENQIIDNPYCPICGKLRNYRHGEFTSLTCGNKICIKEYNHRTCKEKYKVDNYLQLKKSKDKRKNTNIKKYHKNWYTQTKEFQIKSNKTKLLKYGKSKFDNDLKIKKSLIKNGVKHIEYLSILNLIDSWKKYIIPLFKKEEYEGLNKIYKWKCCKCGKEFYSTIHTTRHLHDKKYDRMPRCFNCFPRIRGKSKEEIELINFCKQFYPNLKTNNKQLIGKELDIIIPELKIAIEFNGIYWHSIEKSKNNKSIHLIKTKLCENMGYRLIHVWENDWLKNKNIILNNLKNIFINKEKIPILKKYDYSWYSPLQFKNKQIFFYKPKLIKNLKFHVFNCGYFELKNKKI